MGEPFTKDLLLTVGTRLICPRIARINANNIYIEEPGVAVAASKFYIRQDEQDQWDCDNEES